MNIFVRTLGLVLTLILVSNIVSADNKTIKLEITLPNEVMLGLMYDTLFKITNLNYSKNYDSHVNVTVYYNLSKDGILLYENNFSKIINSFSTSSNGYIYFNQVGSVVLCGSSSLAESTCKNLTVISPLALGCSVGVNLSVQKTIFYNNEQVEIRNIVNMQPPQEFPFILEYWVEDLFGEIVKNRLNTSNTNTKTFTTDIEERTGVFIAKNKLVYVGCNNTNENLESSVLFVVKNQDYTKPVCEETSEKQATSEAQVLNEEIDQEKGEITSFYTRTKNFNETINIYANIKSPEGGYLFLTGNTADLSLRLEGENASQKFTFNVGAKKGENVFYLELYEYGESVDKKSLIFSLADVPKKAPKAAALKKPANTTAMPKQASKSVKEQPKNISPTQKNTDLNNAKVNILETSLIDLEPINESIAPGLVVYEVERPKIDHTAMLWLGSGGFIAVAGYFAKKKIRKQLNLKALLGYCDVWIKKKLPRR